MPAMDIWPWIFTVFSLILSKKIKCLIDCLVLMRQFPSLIDNTTWLLRALITLSLLNLFIMDRLFSHANTLKLKIGLVFEVSFYKRKNGTLTYCKIWLIWDAKSTLKKNSQIFATSNLQWLLTNEIFVNSEGHLIKINITRRIMKPRPNMWWNLVMGDIAWRWAIFKKISTAQNWYAYGSP